jgi:hypothetical protein
VNNFSFITKSSGDIGVACKHGRLSIDGIGEIYLNMPFGKSLRLCNVIHSSNAARNILSVNEITKLGFLVTFTADGWQILNSDQSVFLCGKAVNGLYILETSNAEVNHVIKSSTYDTWHNRMGHPGQNAMKIMKKSCPSDMEK